MFGLNKLKDAQKKAEELKSELASMEFVGESLNGMAKVRCNGAKQILSVEINDNFINVRPKEDVETMLVEACNEALGYADHAGKNKLREIMPTIPGLNF